MAKRKPGGLLRTQELALAIIWRCGGVDAAYCTVRLGEGLDRRIQAATVVALVGRGLLAGHGDGMIQVTEAGAKLAPTCWPS